MRASVRPASARRASWRVPLVTARAQARRSRPALRAAGVACAAAALLAGACATPEPEKQLALSDVEAYWAVDSTAGDTVYVAPVVRLRLANKSATQSIEATATFRRKGETANWGHAWERVSWSQKRVAPGESVTLALKSDGRYYTTGAPDSVFEHELFKDAHVEVFLRVGASPWVKMAEADVARRIGSKTLEDLGVEPPS